MDAPGLDPRMHAAALAGLRRVNRLSRVRQVLLRHISMHGAPHGAPLRILDVACGSGDLVVWLARKLACRGVPTEVSGCDIRSTAIDEARRLSAAAKQPAEFFLHDAVRTRLPPGYDVVTCSLFLHHLDEDDAVRLLANLAEGARSLVLLDDLRRTRLGYLLAWFGSRLLSRSPVVHVDGPLSVAAAFTPDEARELATRAGLVGATIELHWPERFLLSWAQHSR